MFTYEVTDPRSGRVLELTGDSPPTEQELESIFSQYAPASKDNILAKGFSALGSGIEEVINPISDLNSRLRGQGLVGIMGEYSKRLESLGAGNLEAMSQLRPQDIPANIYESLAGRRDKRYGDVLAGMGIPDYLAAPAGLAMATAADPFSYLGAPSKAGLLEKGVASAEKGYRNFKKVAMESILRMNPKDVARALSSNFAGFTRKLVADGSAESIQKLGNTMAWAVDRYLYKPASKAWDDVADKAASMQITPTLATEIAKKAAFVANDLSPHTARVHEAIIDVITRPYATTGDLITLIKELRPLARRDPMAIHAIEAISDPLAKSFKEYEHANVLWTKYKDASLASKNVFGGATREPEITAVHAQRLAKAASASPSGPYARNLNRITSSIEESSGGRIAKGALLGKIKNLASVSGMTTEAPKLTGFTLVGGASLALSRLLPPGAGRIIAAGLGSLVAMESVPRLSAIAGKTMLNTFSKLRASAMTPAAKAASTVLGSALQKEAMNMANEF